MMTNWLMAAFQLVSGRVHLLHVLGSCLLYGERNIRRICGRILSYIGLYPVYFCVYFYDRPESGPYQGWVYGFTTLEVSQVSSFLKAVSMVRKQTC